MKVLACALLLVLAGLQYRLWASDDGMRSLIGLEDSVAAQRAENDGLLRRNAQLAAEVTDLKQGLVALEERARNDLGMIGPNETFFQVVESGAPGPTAPLPLAPPVTPDVQRTAR